MTTLTPRWIETARAALESSFGPVTGRPAGWLVTLNHGTNRTLDAQLDGDWLALLSGESDGSAEAAISVREAAALAPGIKRVGRHLIAEIPLIEPGMLDDQIARLARHFPVPASGPPRAAQTADAGIKPDYASLCREAGWQPVERPDGRIDVQLECRRAYHQAQLDATAGMTRAFARLRERPPASGPAQRATIAILLAVSAAIRMVRPLLEQAPDGTEIAGFEVLLCHPLLPQVLARAFGALSVAADACGPELALVEDPAWAERFLSVSAASIAAPAIHKQNEGEPKP